MCNISIYQILLSFNALLYEEFSHRDETEASLLYFFVAFYIAGLNIRLLGMKNSNHDDGLFIFCCIFAFE